jgi:hypothetical protein
MTESPTTHSHARELPSYEDLNTPLILLVGMISAIVTLLTILFVQGLYYHWKNSALQKRSDQLGVMPAVVQINDQKNALKSCDVPIEDAMKKVVATYGKSSN